MAADPKTLFTVDIGKIIAKLHLAGKTQAPNFIVVNTAIKDESESDNPEKPGNAKCTFESKDGTYQVAFIKLDFEHTEEVDPYKDPAIAKEKEKVEKTKEKNSNLTSPSTTVSAEVKQLNTLIGKLIKDVKPESSNDEIKAAIEKENEARKAKKEEELNKLKSDVAKEANAYFDTFYGKGNTKAGNADHLKIGNDSLTLVQISDKVKNIKTIDIKDCKIVPIEEKELEKQKEEYYKDQTKKIKTNIAFTIEYKLEIDND